MFVLRIINKLGGGVMGKLSLIWPPKLFIVTYVFERGYATSRNKTRFKQFGERSLLASNQLIIHPENITIGTDSSIQRYCVLETCPIKSHKPNLVIGNNVSIGEYSHITCANSIKIGNGVLTGRFVLITDNAHGTSNLVDLDIPPLKRFVYSKGTIEIGDNVWLGDKVTILPGVKIGKGSVIAANAVVTKDIPSYSIAGGCPAKIIKTINL